MYKIRKETALLFIVLFGAILATYWQVGSHEFINFDDNTYLYENKNIKDGLSIQSLSWALTASHASNWHPVTWISHIIDIEIFGMNAGRHHAINVLFHFVLFHIPYTFIFVEEDSFLPHHPFDSCLLVFIFSSFLFV